MAIQVTIKPYGFSSMIKPKNNEKEQALPQYHCSSCEACSNKYCNVFDRRIEPDYNKCFNHTNYGNRQSVYQAPANLEEIVLANEKQRYV